MAAYATFHICADLRSHVQFGYITCPACGLNRDLFCGTPARPCLCGLLKLQNVLYTTRFHCIMPDSVALVPHNRKFVQVVLMSPITASLAALDNYLYTRPLPCRLHRVSCGADHFVYIHRAGTRDLLPFGPLGDTVFYFQAPPTSKPRCAVYIITCMYNCMPPSNTDPVTVVCLQPATMQLIWPYKVSLLAALEWCIHSANMSPVVAIRPCYALKRQMAAPGHAGILYPTIGSDDSQALLP